jgi:membrane protein
VAGIAGAGWAASGSMSAIIKAVNRAYAQQERRPFWKLRLIALALVLGTALITASLLLLIVFGEPIGEAIAAQAGLGAAFDFTWGVLRWPIAFLAILLFLAVVYYVAPTLEQRDWRWVSPGSLVAATAWLLISWAFSLYTRYAGNYDETYGALAGAIVFLLWLNFSAMALLFGAELNAEADRQADVRATGGPRAGLTERARRSE